MQKDHTGSICCERLKKQMRAMHSICRSKMIMLTKFFAELPQNVVHAQSWQRVNKRQLYPAPAPVRTVSKSIQSDTIIHDTSCP